jgi:hypothetical protein
VIIASQFITVVYEGKFRVGEREDALDRRIVWTYNSFLMNCGILGPFSLKVYIYT